METIKGTVKYIVYENTETGFKVLNVKTAGGPHLKVIGEFSPEVVVGTIANFHGDYKIHLKYGTNFKTSGYNVLHNVGELASIRLFLDAIAPNIGPERAAQITAHFGSDLIGILDNNPQRLTEVEGVGKVSAESLAVAWEENKDKWAEQRQEYTLRAFLYSLEIKERRVKRILSYFGGGLSAEESIRENPYRLTEIEGFGFSTADFVARKLGLLESDPMRLKAFIFYTLKVLCPKNGHLYLTENELLVYVNEFCSKFSTNFLSKVKLIVSDMVECIEELVLKGTLIRDKEALYSKGNYLSETQSAVRITNIFEKPTDLILLNELYVNNHIAQFERTNSITLSDEQRDALHYFVGKKVFVITGAPGTGKTTVLQAIVDLVLHLKLKLTCLTPTGISAKKMASTIKYNASTIHRCLGFRGDEWLYGDRNKYLTDVVIIDEACLPYKQFINLADGGKKYIGTIVNQKLPLHVLSYNTDKKTIESKRITNWFKYPYKNPLYKIKLSKAYNRERQRILRCTGNHKIYTEQGKKKASEITKEDKVLIKGVFLNPFQRSFLMGSILGDAHINKNDSGKIISFVQGQSQKDYLFLKSRIFKCSDPYQCRGGYIPEKKLWRCASKVIDNLDDIYKYTYPKGVRSVTKKLLDQIDEIGLAVWYMDNGSLTSQKHRYYTALFHTEGFTKKECDLIVKWFKKKWNINSSVYPNRKYFLIRLTCESALKLWELILPWVIPSMAYKFPPGYAPNFQFQKQEYIKMAPYPVQSISKYEPKDNLRKFIYDIEVEGNHNYFSNNVLVSNSMVDMEVFFRLLSALKDRVHIIFVGDDHQLPSVGAGNVLRQLINCGVIPVVRLEQIFRQDEASDIIKVAHRIKNGDTNLSLFKGDPKADVFFIRENKLEIVENYVIRLAQKFKDEKRMFQIITPRNSGPLSVDSLNKSLQNILNPEGFESERDLGNFIVRRGDRVIITKNDYELKVFNGEVGKVIHLGDGFIKIRLSKEEETEEKKEEIEDEFNGIFNEGTERDIKFSNEDARMKIKLAYALTIHRSQGQEYPFIILPFITQYGRNMLQRNLLYTAITRAKEKVIIIGHGAALERAINNSSVNKRNTRLGERIIRCLELKKKSFTPTQFGGPANYLDAHYDEVPF